MPIVVLIHDFAGLQRVAAALWFSARSANAQHTLHVELARLRHGTAWFAGCVSGLSLNLVNSLGWFCWKV